MRVLDLTRLADATVALKEPGTLALFGFGAGSPGSDDPRYLRVALECFDAPAPLEIWQVDAPVIHGTDGALHWSAGGGWLFAAIELDESRLGGPSATAQLAYEQLHRFVAARGAQHVLRVWNYLGAINHGEGDAELQDAHRRRVDDLAEGQDGEDEHAAPHDRPPDGRHLVALPGAGRGAPQPLVPEQDQDREQDDHGERLAQVEQRELRQLRVHPGIGTPPPEVAVVRGLGQQLGRRHDSRQPLMELLLEVREDNRPAIAFYAARGLVEIDRRPRYYRDGATAVVMRLPLTKGCG